MTMVPNQPTLMISVEISTGHGSAAVESASRFRGELAESPVTWLTDEPGQLLKWKLAAEADEIGLNLGGELQRRADLNSALNRAIAKLAGAGRELRTVALHSETASAHWDLLARQGVIAICDLDRAARGKKQLMSRAAGGLAQPTRSRFGLWRLPATLHMSTRRDASTALNRDAHASGSKFEHVVLTEPCLQNRRVDVASLAKGLLRSRRSSASISQPVSKTASEIAGWHNQQLCGRPATSILRRAA